MTIDALDATALALARFDLTDRVAVVSGGGSGLGAAIATAMAEHGATVALIDVSDAGCQQTARAVEALGRPVSTTVADVRDGDQLEQASDAIERQFGRIDILVNSAGVTYRSPAEEFPDEEFDRVLDVNLKGTFFACRAFGRRMLARRSGSIVNLASIGGLVGYPESAAYIASKGGVVNLTRGLAVEWIDRGVRVNAIAPSIIETPLLRGVGVLSGGGSDADRSAARPTASRGGFIIERSLRGTGSVGQPSDVAGVAVFLASDAARMITGHTLPVDDGYVAA